ncbi:hypothetical protein Deipr_2726 (plasmid) [Deinococcus proteolyticus MRP]|uniref:Uncharacterized protein n=1 Tax=Deinococcus proteolyticus (strain ATCC 35074 / DSM 20540 / JCM 6276 / NBRC 101906 / NCIMB 13154 / VKM Ac-1939 / CCM 2703 / MRP) TaxID=693977 RepID=F0RRB3_DEIPM|nr:hypothetical protein [Deinococcus proteolyticus]ADY27822.1 hypothetical protein Deipr_2726 [Deinococcus proteolyticus MRP]
MSKRKHPKLRNIRKVMSSPACDLYVGGVPLEDAAWGYAAGVLKAIHGYSDAEAATELSRRGIRLIVSGKGCLACGQPGQIISVFAGAEGSSRLERVIVYLLCPQCGEQLSNPDFSDDLEQQLLAVSSTKPENKHPGQGQRILA